MAKDIERIIESSVVPEMEYTKTRRKLEVNEVPEVVLPKTKAEMYDEAKSRLTQKTIAASSAYAGQKKRVKTSTPKVKTFVLDESAQPVVDADTRKPDGKTNRAAAANRYRTVEETRLLKRVNGISNTVEDPKWVGTAEDLIPFSWRAPLLLDLKRPSKYYRATVKERREMYLPVLRDK